jgi:hypothetical protein
MVLPDWVYNIGAGPKPIENLTQAILDVGDSACCERT